MEIRPRSGVGITIGVAASLVLTGTALAFARRVAGEPVSLTSFAAGLVTLALLLGGGLVLYWTWELATLRYRLDDDHLSIRWGFTEHIIPYSAITAAHPAEGAPPRTIGVDWPGYHLGRARTAGVGEVLLASAHVHSRELLYITAGGTTYGISARNPQQTAQEVLERQTATGTEVVPAPTLRQPLALALPLWNDAPAHGLLGLGLLANLVLFAHVCYVYPALPALLPLRFAIDGAVDQIGQREELLVLPVAALAILVINAAVSAVLHRNERLGAYLCLGAAALVQVFVAAAVVRIIG